MKPEIINIFSAKNEPMSILPSIDQKQKNQLQSFSRLSEIFEERFNKRHFPEEPKQLYDASQYLLTVRGKRNQACYVPDGK